MHLFRLNQFIVWFRKDPPGDMSEAENMAKVCITKIIKSAQNIKMHNAIPEWKVNRKNAWTSIPSFHSSKS